MKYSEFNKKLYEFELQHYLSDVHIFCDGNLVGKVSKKCRYSLSTIYEVFEDLPEKVAFMLYENMMMLAETPLAEREEKKRYYLRFVNKTLAGDRAFLNKLADNDGVRYYVDTKNEHNGYQTIFTESEISQMDITGFEKVEVPENE